MKLILALLLFASTACMANTFKLEDPKEEEVAVLCFSAEPAMAIAEQAARFMDNTITSAVLAHQIVQKRCIAIEKVVVTYKSLVFRAHDRTGTPISVYKALVMGKETFVPMVGWVHEEI